MKQLKKLAGETILYGLGSIVPRFLNFLLVPLHTAVFKPEDYGVITKLFAYVAVVNIVFMFGMETTYFRFATKPEADEKKIFNLSQTAVGAISLILSLLFIFTAVPLSQVLNIAGHANIIVWFAVIMFMDAIVAIPFARLRLQKKAAMFAIGKLINIFILVGLNLYFLKVAYNPAVGIGYVILALLVANLFYVLFFYRTLFSWRPAFDRLITPEMFRYAYPVMLMGVAGMVNEMFSRITLEAWLPDNFYPGQSAEYALGIFGACFKFAMLMGLAVTAFRYAAEPFFFSNASNKNSPGLFAKVNHYFIIVCCVLMLGVGINLDVLKYFLGDKAYWEGLSVVPVLLLAYLFLGIYYNTTVWFKLTDRTYFGTIITIIGVVVTIGFNFLLIPWFGYMGSSWASLLCYLSMAAISYFLGQKYYPIPYLVGKGVAYIVLTTALVYSVNSVNVANPWVAIGFHQAVLLFYLMAVYFLERQYFRQPV